MFEHSTNFQKPLFQIAYPKSSTFPYLLNPKIAIDLIFSQINDTVSIPVPIIDQLLNNLPMPYFQIPNHQKRF